MTTITFKLYDTAEHRYLKPDDYFIKGNGEIWYNNSRKRGVKIWEKLHESGEGMEIRDIRVLP